MRKSTFTIKDAQKYLGFFGDSMIMGLVIGFAIGFLAGYDIKAILQLGVSMSAVLVLIPKMTSLFMEGLMPISDAAQGWSQKKFKGRKLFIGLDAAVVVGNQDVITTALIIIPLTIALALVLPGNRVLPFADLAVVPFRVAMVVALTRGNLLKNIVIGLVVTASLLWCGSATAPILTEIAKSVGIDLGSGAMLISSFASTALIDPIFIFGWFGVPAMSIKGAAIATVIGQTLAMLAAIFAIKFQKQSVKVSFKNLHWDWKMIKEIYIISIPSFLLLSIGSLMVSGVNFILKGFSETSVAVFGIYYKLQSFVYMPISGLVQGTLPIMSYSCGAKNRNRLLETLKISLVLSGIFSLLGMIIFWIAPSEVIGLFSSETQLMNMGSEALRTISISFLFGAICYVFSSYFQATGSSLFSLMVTLLRQLFLILPIAFLLSSLWGVSGVWRAFVLAEVIIAILALFLFKYEYSRKRIYRQQNVSPEDVQEPSEVAIKLEK